MDIIQLILSDFNFFIPETVLSVLFVILILVGLIFKTHKHFLVPVILLSGLLLTAYFEYAQFSLDKIFFSNLLSISYIKVYIKLILIFSSILGVIITVTSQDLKTFGKEYFEHWAVIAAIIFGGNLLIMSANFMMLFLALEIVSIGFYVLIGLFKSKQNAESVLKYILFGMFASALSLYGISMIFGETGGMLDFASNQFVIKMFNLESIGAVIGIVFFLGGVLFKLTAFPFQLWAPDLYEATPEAIIAFTSNTGKILGFGVLITCMPWLMNLKFGLFNIDILMTVIAFGSILIGNFSALFQTNIKRLLAYSSIAHTGFGLILFINYSTSSPYYLCYYLVFFTLTNYLIFSLVNAGTALVGDNQISSYSGLGLVYPAFGVLFIVAAISLAGLPPTSGFLSKLLVFSHLWDIYQYRPRGYEMFIFIFGLINVVVSIFFYLKIPYMMFFKPIKNEQNQNMLSWHVYLLGIILSVAIFIQFFKADWFLMAE
jgi:NADH-quinone oxidoreductase subunit N